MQLFQIAVLCSAYFVSAREDNSAFRSAQQSHSDISSFVLLTYDPGQISLTGMEFLHEFLDARFVGAVKDFARAVQREGIQSTGPAAASTLYTPPADVLASVMAATKALSVYSDKKKQDVLPAPASRAPSVPRKRAREGRANAAPAGYKKRTGLDGEGMPTMNNNNQNGDSTVPSSRLGSSTFSSPPGMLCADEAGQGNSQNVPTSLLQTTKCNTGTSSFHHQQRLLACNRLLLALGEPLGPVPPARRRVAPPPYRSRVFTAHAATDPWWRSWPRVATRCATSPWSGHP